MACHTFRAELALLGLTAARRGPMPFAEPGVQPNYGPSRQVRIEHIDLELDLDVEGRSFSGRAAIRFRRLPTFSGELRLDLDDVTVLAVTDAAGRPLPYVHSGASLNITVGEAVDPQADEDGEVDGDGSVVVTWHHRDPTRGMYFTGPEPWAPDRQRMAWTQLQDEDAHFVLPCHDFPGTKHTWTIKLRGPAGYTLLSNGAELAQGEDDRGAWAVFEQTDPMPAYLLVAVAARLVCEETSWQGRSVRYLVPEGQDEAVLRAFGKTPLMLDHLSAITGVAYPWPRYDQVVVHDFIFGGMENVACTVMTDLLLVDERAVLEWDPDRLVVHELAHQWFGDLLTCQDWSQAWLNESWATFIEAVWWEHDRSAADAAWYRFGHAQGYLAEHGGRYRRPIVTYDFREPIDVFDRHLYEKGACVLNTLRTELGPDAFWAGVHLYLERHRNDIVHSRHFQRALEDATGRNLDRFFHQWIEGAGHPELTVKLSVEGELLTVAVDQGQSGDQVASAFHVPLVIDIVHESGRARRLTLPVRDRSRAFVLPIDEPVRVVRVDPGFNMLSTIAIEAPRDWLERLLHDACPVLSLRAAQALIKEGAPKSLDLVLAALAGHALWQVRGAIAGELTKVGGDRVRAALVDRLAAEDDPRVRKAIAVALGGVRGDWVADALLAEIAREDLGTWHLRAAALESLGKTRDPRAVDAIRPHLDVGGWASLVTAGALKGLAETRAPSVLGDIVELSRPDRPDHARAAAATALGRLGDLVPDLRVACRERLVEMLAEPGFRAQLGAVGALGELGDAAALGPLGALHANAADGRTRRMAYEAMYAIKQGRTTEEGLASLRAQLEALTDENRQLRSRIDKLER
jgi:aminopeptidase N